MNVTQITPSVQTISLQGDDGGRENTSLLSRVKRCPHRVLVELVIIVPLSL